MNQNTWLVGIAPGGIEGAILNVFIVIYDSLGYVYARPIILIKHVN